MKPICKAETHGKIDFDELRWVCHSRVGKKTIKRSMIKARRRFHKKEEALSL
jgi:hypothetical protein